MVRPTAAAINPMSATSQRRRCFASTKLEVVTVSTAVVLATAPLPHDEVDKYGGTEYTKDHRHGHFKRHDDRSADDIGQGNHNDADHDHPRQVGSQIVASEHRDNIGHYQPEKR